MNTLQNLNQLPEWAKKHMHPLSIKGLDIANADKESIQKALRMPFRAISSQGRVIGKVLDIKQTTNSSIDVNINTDPSNRYRFMIVASVAGPVSEEIGIGDIVVTTDMSGFAFVPVRAVPSNPSEPLYIIDAYAVQAVTKIHPTLYFEHLMQLERSARNSSHNRDNEEPREIDLHNEVLF